MRVWHRGSLVFAAALAAGSLRAEVTRTLTADVSGANRTAIEVENLVGTMHVTAGTGEAVAVTATVHAESQSLADQVRLDQTPSDGGARIAVHYPESVHTLRYPAGNEEGVWFLDLFFAGESRRYQGHTFRVSHSRGRLLYVDLEVRVPARGADARLRNLVGRVEASGVEGRLAFEVDSADLSLERLNGTIRLRGTSGDIHASGISGDWSSLFTSGDCKLRGFHGTTLTLETTSGDVDAADVTADRLDVRTTSGDVSLQDSDVGEIQSRSTSGNFDFEPRTNRLARARIEATSGDVRFRLPRDASFEAEASLDSGDFDMRFSDAAVTSRGESRMAWQRGSGGAQIRVHTTSGNITIEPH